VTVSTNTIDQSQAAGGDQWVTITDNLYLAGADAPYVLLQNNGSGPMIADALYVSSTQNRYNDGSAVSQVTLAPFDAVLLERLTPNQTIVLDAQVDGATGTVRSAAATASSGLPVSLSSNTPKRCSISEKQISLISAGICSITARQPGSGSYGAAVPVTTTFRISATATAQAITFGTLEAQANGARPFAIGGGASSDLIVGFASTTSSVCTVSAGTVTLVGTGMCSITATQPGNADYTAAQPVTQTFRVVKG
jgi:hypothetical protein